MPNTLPDLLGGSRSALVIATVTYTDQTLTGLRSPARDAQDLADVLGNPDIGKFTVTPKIDSPAQEIRLSLENFLTDREPDDLLMVYLSCHGVRDRRGRLYFAATDTRTDRLASTGVESRWLFDLLDDCRARRQVVILDCCFSGAFADHAKAKAAGAMGEDDLKERLVGHGRGRFILTASRSYEYSFEGESLTESVAAGSVFTTGLIEGLRTGEADTNQDGYISIEEAYNYAFNYVQDKGAAQTPQRWLYGGEAVIWLAASPSRRTAKPARVPESLRAALESPLPEVRLSGVAILRQWFTSGEASLAIAARKELEQIANNDIPRVAESARAVLTQTSPPLAESEPARMLTGHRSWIRSLAFSPDGTRLASGGDDKDVRLWNPTTGQLQEIMTDHTDWVQSVAFSPAGNLLASAGDDAGVRLWDPATGQLLHTLTGHRGPVYSVVFSRDGNLLASASKDMTVRLWDPATRQLLSTLDGHRSAIWSAALSPDGALLASAGDTDVRLWDPNNGQLRYTLTDHRGPIRSVAFHPNGTLLASAGDDADVRLWDVATGQLRHTLDGHRGSIRGLAFHPNGNLLASAGDDADIRLWDPATGQLLHTLVGHRGWVRGLAFSPDGSLLASAGKDLSIRLWSLVPQA